MIRLSRLFDPGRDKFVVDHMSDDIQIWTTIGLSFADMLCNMAHAGFESRPSRLLAVSQ